MQFRCSNDLKRTLPSMILSFEGIIYLTLALTMLWLFYTRKKGLSRISTDTIPELAKDDRISQLKELLNSAYERTLYLAISLFLLSYTTLFNREEMARGFFTLLAVGMFFYNIPPRHKAMKILLSCNLSYGEIRRRGIKL